MRGSRHSPGERAGLPWQRERAVPAAPLRDDWYETKPALSGDGQAKSLVVSKRAIPRGRGLLRIGARPRRVFVRPPTRRVGHRLLRRSAHDRGELRSHPFRLARGAVKAHERGRHYRPDRSPDDDVPVVGCGVDAQTFGPRHGRVEVRRARTRGIEECPANPLDAARAEPHVRTIGRAFGSRLEPGPIPEHAIGVRRHVTCADRAPRARLRRLRM